MEVLQHYASKIRQPLFVLAGVWFLVNSPGQAHATTVTEVCNTAGNVCNAGTANINVLTNVTDGSTLDFTTAGLKVVVNNGGKLQLAPKQVTQAQCLANNQSSTMTILAPEVDIKAGGIISGDNNLAGNTHRNGGAIFMVISQDNGSSGSLIVEPDGKLTSDVIPSAKGRGGVITVVADGQILVQASQNGTVRGLISADSADGSLVAFSQGCGRAEITLIGTGIGAPGGNAVVIDGTVRQFGGNVEAVMAGKINILAGSDAAALQNNPPFPNPGILTRANPPDDTARTVINQTGLVNVDCRDDGGCEVHIFGCIVLIEGLVNLGNEAVIINGIPFPSTLESREQILPVVAEVVANEDIIIQNGGRIFADLREGFRRHKIQPAGSDSIYYNADDPLCALLPVNPPTTNGPFSGSPRGGADICLTARRSVQLDGTAIFYAGPDGQFGTADDRFNVSAGMGNQFNTQTAGRIRVWQTDKDETGIELVGNNLTASTPQAAGNKGGLIEMQSASDTFDINGVVLARGGAGASAQGGIIRAQNINAPIVGTPGGKLNATGGAGALPGTIALATCGALQGFPPATATPNPNVSNVCGTAGVITIAIVLKPCQGEECFCLNDAKIKNNTLTINGEHFGTGSKGVTRVEVNATSCDPGSGTVINNFTKTATKITAPFVGSFTVGRFVILSNPGPDGTPNTGDDVGPSSSCSLACTSATECP